MNARAGTDWAASALKWWQDAGVDTMVGEDPHDWLNPKPPAPSAPAAAPHAPAAAPAPQAPRSEPMPDTLEAFQAWLLATDSLPAGAPAGARVGPAGDPGSGLMVMVDMPSTEGTMLSAEAGALFDRMMAAIGRSRDTLYLASLSPARTATGSLDPGAAAALSIVARRHVGLVAPRALLLFGDACAKALIGPAVAGARARWHALETSAGPVRTLGTISPAKLVTQPGLTKLAWEDLQLLQKELEA